MNSAPLTQLTRRHWLKSTATIAAAAGASHLAPRLHAAESATAPVLDIGSRLEPFLDRHLIDRLTGATLSLQTPAKAPRPKSPLIGAYATVIKDGDRFRAVYRGYNSTYKGKQHDGNPGK